MRTEHGLEDLEEIIRGMQEHFGRGRLAATTRERLEKAIAAASAAMRCGFIVARPDQIEKLTDLNIVLSLDASRMSAEFTLRTLTDGTYRKHVEGLRQRLSRALSQTSERLYDIGIMPWAEPRGGMFLWCELPEGFDSAEVARRALAQNVVLAPGNVFSLSQAAFPPVQCGAVHVWKAVLCPPVDSAAGPGTAVNAAARHMIRTSPAHVLDV